MNTHGATEQSLTAGVVGVGSMGEHHARVYSELPRVRLAGVSDADRTRAEQIADRYGTRSLPRSKLFDRCDLVSVAVPTDIHEETVSRALAAGTHVLVEKPIAPTGAASRRLERQAREEGLVLQVGHVERFNPAVRTAREIVADLDVVALDARRLGPPVDDRGTDGVVLDLMIHDVDVATWTLGTSPTTMSAAGTGDQTYATATLSFDGIIGTLTASRATQRKVRQLAITARECFVLVDYLEQSVTVHRDSYPEYVRDDGRTRFRHESVVERPQVEAREPLRAELEAFVDAVRSGDSPPVPPAEAIEALETVLEIEQLAAGGDRS